LGAEDFEFSFRPDLGVPQDSREIETLAQSEKRHVERALASTGWNITQTARLLEISPTTLRKKIDDYGLRG